MVSCYLQGGLGNYMFQIAASYSLAKDNECEAIFSDKNYFKAQKNLNTYKDNIFRKIKFKNNLQYDIVYNEPSFGYNEIKYKDGIYLIGYFQSEKYFKHNRKDILELFKPSKDDLDTINEKYGHLLNEKNCSLHVRRGDYLKIQYHHPVCGKDYYTNAMAAMPDGTTFLVFSDDMEWCKENFIGDQFIFVEGENDVTDLWIMSYCKHNIIANSSFSWWGAWLNGYKHKIVVAPLKWFGPAKGDIKTDDIYAENWIRI
jgi:hypothetical protein